ncbi:MAG TPA: outer membrane beta-barrel protein [Candidatus Acidoferrum sp.]|nr:outer membrane beta-barrel protein [Candidatus Acidoferrum sp.]
MRRATGNQRTIGLGKAGQALRRVTRAAKRGALYLCVLSVFLFCGVSLRAQEQGGRQTGAANTSASGAVALQARVERLEAEVAELKQLLRGNAAYAPFANGPVANGLAPNGGGAEPASANAVQVAPAAASGVQSGGASPAAALMGTSPDDRKELDFLHDTTINVGLDGYYSYNFNSPVGRVNLLRAYDVLSNNFNLNQASIIFEHAPNLEEGRRWGARVDLQFGQATDTLQGNPLNEPRPDIYRNIFQAYGTYIVPVGKGLVVDFGKWSSSIGIEGNYTKDQMNYSRSYYFNFLPFYHMGVRANYALNDRFTLTYWVVNGTNQVEATNSFKDELFGFTAKPLKSLTWVVNYYLGQEHPDRVEVTPTSPIPVQPGLSFEAIRPAPNGRLHIFDSYVTWQASPKLSFALEGDYVIQRLWRNQAPGESAAPSHVIGGAGYARYEFSSRLAVAARAEYLSDRGGLFSGLNQALKETTATLDYKLNEGFLMRYEWRRDFSNQPSFLTDTQGLLSKQQTTASVGLVWWWGRKEGAW